eukprot:814559-Rhodomonas_salina.1
MNACSATSGTSLPERSRASWRLINPTGPGAAGSVISTLPRASRSHHSPPSWFQRLGLDLNTTPTDMRSQTCSSRSHRVWCLHAHAAAGTCLLLVWHSKIYIGKLPPPGGGVAWLEQSAN